MFAKDRQDATTPKDVAIVRPIVTCRLIATAASGVPRNKAVTLRPEDSPSAVRSSRLYSHEKDSAPAPCTIYTDADSELAGRGNAVHIPEHAGSVALIDVTQAVPAILDLLPPTSLAALAMVSKEHCLQASKHATCLSFSTQYAAPLFASESWPRLKSLHLFDITGGPAAPVHRQISNPDNTNTSQSPFLAQLPNSVSEKQHCSPIVKSTPSLLRRKAINTTAVSSMVAAQMHQLQHLSISGSLHTLALQQLGSASYPALHTLELSHVGMTLDGLQGVLQHPIQMLEVLDLSGNMLSRDAVPTLHAQHWPKLRKLILADNRNLLDFFNHDAGFVGALTWPKLESLDMSYCPLSFRRQIRPVSLPQLTSLTVAASWFGLDYDAMLVIVRAGMGNLTSLDLSRNKLDEEAVQMLSTGEWPHLKHLVLSGISGDRLSMRFLAQGKWPKLESLEIQGNNLKEHALQELFAGAWPALRSIQATIDAWYLYVIQQPGCNHNPLHLWQASSRPHRWSVQQSAKPLTMAKHKIYMNIWPWHELHHVVLHDYLESPYFWL